MNTREYLSQPVKFHLTKKWLAFLSLSAIIVAGLLVVWLVFVHTNTATAPQAPPRKNPTSLPANPTTQPKAGVHAQFRPPKD